MSANIIMDYRDPNEFSLTGPSGSASVDYKQVFGLRGDLPVMQGYDRLTIGWANMTSGTATVTLKIHDGSDNFVTAALTLALSFTTSGAGGSRTFPLDWLSAADGDAIPLGRLERLPSRFIVALTTDSAVPGASPGPAGTARVALSGPYGQDGTV